MSAHKTSPTEQSEAGFMLPSLLVLMALLAIIGTAMIQTTLRSLTASVRHSYTQMAHVASKAGIDYAEEAYELSPSYSGTNEFELISNENYKITIEIDVLYDQGASAKRIQSFGRVYIPESSTTASYVRDIKASIIRNGELAGNPGDYYPIVWLDAGHDNTLYEGPTSNSQTVNALYGASNADNVEEFGSDASNNSNRGNLGFTTNVIEMPCVSNNPPCGGSFGTQKVGLRFRSLSVPKNATITDAYIQFTQQSSQSAGTVNFNVRGIAQDNPASWSGNYDVTNRLKTTASTAWSPPNWNTSGGAGATERVSVTSIIQELVNRSGWNPTQAMAFVVEWVSGSGVRKAHKGNGSNPKPQLYIQWTSAGGQEATDNGDTIDRWEDISGSGNHAVFTYGTRPTLQTSQINSLPGVRFSANGVLKSTLAAAKTGQGVTVMAVMKPRSTSSTDARFVSLMNSAQAEDFDNLSGIAILKRSSSSSTVQQTYNNVNAESISSAIDGNWAMYTSRMGATRTERLLKNSTPDNYSELSNNMNYTIDQVFVGGRRSGSVGANYADMDIAELVVYDKELSCSQLQLVEYYFSSKYNITISFKDPCP